MPITLNKPEGVSDHNQEAGSKEFTLRNTLASVQATIERYGGQALSAVLALVLVGGGIAAGAERRPYPPPKRSGPVVVYQSEYGSSPEQQWSDQYGVSPTELAARQRQIAGSRGTYSGYSGQEPMTAYVSSDNFSGRQTTEKGWDDSAYGVTHEELQQAAERVNSYSDRR